MKKELSPEVIKYRQVRRDAKKRRRKKRDARMFAKKIFLSILGVSIFLAFPVYCFIQAYVHDIKRLSNVVTFNTTIEDVHYDHIFQSVKRGGSLQFITFDTIRGKYVFWIENETDVALFNKWESTDKELTITVSPIKSIGYYKPWGGYLRVIEIKDANTTYFSSDEYVDWVKREHKSSLYVGYGSLVFFLLLILLFAYPLGVYSNINDSFKAWRTKRIN